MIDIFYKKNDKTLIKHCANHMEAETEIKNFHTHRMRAEAINDKNVTVGETWQESNGLWNWWYINY